MDKQIQITASSIGEIMNEINKVADQIRRSNLADQDYNRLVDYWNRLNLRVELHLKAKETREKEA